MNENNCKCFGVRMKEMLKDNYLMNINRLGYCFFENSIENLYCVIDDDGKIEIMRVVAVLSMNFQSEGNVYFSYV